MISLSSVRPRARLFSVIVIPSTPIERVAHQAPVAHVASSPDNVYCATASDNGR